MNCQLQLPVLLESELRDLDFMKFQSSWRQPSCCGMLQMPVKIRCPRDVSPGARQLVV